MGLGSVLSEEEGVVSPPSFYCNKGLLSTFATIESFVSFQTQTSQHFASITQYVDSVSSEVSIIAGEVDSQGSEIARISVRVNNVEGSVIDLEADVINLDGDITNIDSRVTNINGRLNAAEGDISSLSSRTATIERAYITEADVDRIVANEINGITITASKIYLGGRQCQSVNVMRNTQISRSTGTFVTKVTPTVKNGVVTAIKTNTGSAVTAVALTNASMATVVGYAN